MRLATPRLVTVLCLLLGLSARLAQGRDDALSAIPAEADGFVVIHNLSDTSKAIGELAKLVHAPAPDLLSLAKGMTGLQKGIDEEGDVALVLTGVESAPKHVVLLPVTNFDDFFAALKVEGATTGIVEAQLLGRPMVVGRKGTFAAVTPEADREALEKFLASTTNLTGDASLAEWVAANKLSVALTSTGVKNLIPKAADAVRGLQAQMRKSGGENGEVAANGMNMYLDLFTAAETELEQFGIGVRIDSAQTVDITSRAKFTAGGSWVRWTAESKPNTEDLLGGLEAKPFVVATGATVSQTAMQEMMKMSVKMMQNQPTYNLTPEQAKRYLDVWAGMMGGVKSARILMGVAEATTGLYGNTSMVATVDDSKAFLDTYEKSLAESRKLTEEIKNPAMPVATTQHIKLGDIDALEISMTLPDLKQLKTPGGPDAQKIMQLFVGPDGKLTSYLAAADEHTVVMAYISADHLKEAIEFYKSKKPGVSADAGVVKVASKLPEGAQFVGYASVGGMSAFMKQVLAAVPGARAAAIPEFPDSPPFGFAVKASPTGVEGHFVATSETLRAIGDAVAKTKAAAGQQPPQQQ